MDVTRKNPGETESDATTKDRLADACISSTFLGQRMDEPLHAVHTRKGKEETKEKER